MHDETNPNIHTRRGQAVWWVIAVSLAVIATSMVLRLDEPWVNPTFGQAVRQSGARGIFAFTGQLSSGTHGVFMVDVDNMTIWCYEYGSGKKKLRLAAARTWMYDRYLENYECDGLSPEDVEQLVELQRANKLRIRMGNNP